MDVVLDRKIALSEKMRSMFLAVHERADGNGFPKGLFAEKIPIESQMIQFSKEFDRRTVLRIGKARVDQAVVRNQIIAEEIQKMDRFTVSFLDAVKRGFS
jgi:hypothetical protein